MNLSKELINICESIISGNKKNFLFNENNISTKYNIQYEKDDSNELPFSIILSNTTTDRLEYIQNLIQDKIDSGEWKTKSREVDNSITKNTFSSSEGDIVVYYSNNSPNPESIEFQSNRISDEFYKDITLDFLPSDQEEEPEEEPEEPEEEPEGGENDEITPNGFATRNENPDGTVTPGDSANGDDLSSLNIG